MAERAEEEPVYMLSIQREVMLENLDCERLTLTPSNPAAITPTATAADALCS